MVQEREKRVRERERKFGWGESVAIKNRHMWKGESLFQFVEEEKQEQRCLVIAWRSCVRFGLATNTARMQTCCLQLMICDPQSFNRHLVPHHHPPIPTQ